MYKQLLLWAFLALALSACGGGGSSSNNSSDNVSSNISDRDNDNVADNVDNCPDTSNTDQLNTDNDTQGNACDSDDDNDTISDVDEISRGTNPLKADSDDDGVPDNKDDLPLDSNKATTTEKAYRLLTQATFGATKDDLDRAVSLGIEGWINEQFAKPSAYDNTNDAHQTHLERTIEIALSAEPNTDWLSSSSFNQGVADSSSRDYQMATFLENAIGLHPTKTLHGSDQLRQRVAYALSQILVVSTAEAPLDSRGESLAYYYDLLAKHAFGNYRDLLGDITRSPTMGIFLSHQGNQKANPTTGIRPDENFARELMQLFTIGLYELNIDGSANRDGDASTYPDTGTTLVPTYDQQDTEELAKVMTGWDLVGNPRYGRRNSKDGDYTQPMEFTASEHEDEAANSGDGNVTLLGSSFALNSGGDQSGLDSALDVLFNHPNVGPFISKHLIMRLVTSNPSSDYVARVATIFNDNGNGARGDLKTVVRAILEDDEARGTNSATSANFGKAKEPFLALTQLLRAFNARPLDGWKGQDDATLVSGVYWYRTPQSYFGQAPMRSPSVFNFYNPDFVPSDTYFADNSLVSPETQIQTDQMLIEMNNRMYSIIKHFEKNRIEIELQQTLSEYAGGKSYWNQPLLYIDFTPQLNLFEQTLDGDTNGDYANMESSDSQGLRYKAKAVDALILHLDELLLGNTMTAEYHEALHHYLMNASGARSSNDVTEARNVIRDAVRFIISSSAFMIQK